MSTNLQTLYQLLREIAGESAWMIGEMDEYERTSKEAHPQLARARALVSDLDIIARRDLPLELATLWNTLGALGASVPGTPAHELPDPERPARRILEILDQSVVPIGFLIETLEAEQPGTKLAFLLMAGMTGVFTATNALRPQIAQIFTPALPISTGA